MWRYDGEVYGLLQEVAEALRKWNQEDLLRLKEQLKPITLHSYPWIV